MKELQRFVSGLLVLCLMISMMPAPAFATEAASAEPAVETGPVTETAVEKETTAETTVAPETTLPETVPAESEDLETEPEGPIYTAHANQYAASSSVSASGTYGDDITWSIEGTVLTISGDGDIGSENTYNTPGWSGYRFDVETIIIESGVTLIRYGMFQDFEVLTSVTIPNTVTEIKANAFSNCPMLTELAIPASVTSLEYQGLSGLEAYRVDEGNPVYSSDSTGVLFNKDKTQLIMVPQAISGTYTIPDGVLIVDDYAFDNCTGLTALSIPDSVVSLGRIENCSGLTELTIPSRAYYFGGLSYCDGITELEIPGSVTNFGGLRSCDSITELVIPDSVTELGICIDCQGLARVKLPKNITQLPNSMFSSCSALTEIEIPEGITTIGWGAFQNCTSLERIVIPEGITILPDSIFRNSGVSEVVLPQSLTTISSSGAFWGCKNLKEIVLPENLEHVGVSAFLESGLERITIPASVTILCDYVFSDCLSLKEITFLGDAPEFGDDEDDVFDNVTAVAYYPAGNTTWNSTSLRNHGGTITWKASCGSHTLGDVSYTWSADKEKCTASKPCTNSGCEYALTETVSSTSVTVAATCTADGKTTYTASFKDAAFAVQTEEVVLSATGHSWSDPICTVDKVCGSCGAEEAAKDHTFANNVCVDCSIPGGTCGENIGWILDTAGTLTLSGSGAMPAYSTVNYAPWHSLRQQILRVVIEDGITSIGSHAFYWSENLAEVEIPDSVTSIGSSAFYLNAFEEIAIPESVVSIGNYAFEKCGTLKSVTIPASVTTLGNQVFQNCDALESAVFAGVPETVGEYLFSSCDKLSSVELGEGTVSIAKSMFSGCTGLLSFTVPDTVTQIGQSAFSGCTGLTELVLPEGITTIESNTFNGCTSLTEIAIPASVTTIAEKAFYNCTGLKNIRFQSNAPAIGENAFYGVTATALYPADDASWDYNIQYNFGGNITWKADGPVLESLTIQTLPEKTMYQVGDTVDLTGLTLLAKYSEGEDKTVEAGDVTIVSGDTSASGKITVTVGYRGQTAQFEIRVHTVYDVGERLQPSSGYPQSAHNYPNNANLSYSYSVEGAQYLKLTFSSSTKVENNFDYIYLYDGNDTQIGKYTGTTLAGKTIQVSGDTVKIKLTSDSSSTYYGFALTSVYASMNEVIHEPSDEGVYTDPLCFVDGYTTHTCRICDETYVVQDTGSAVHAFENGYCSVCGVPEGLTSGGWVNETVAWAMMEDGTLHITGTGTVTAGDWKDSVKTATALVVHGGITEIGEYAFGAMTALKTVDLEEGLTVIGRRAFDGCTAMTTVTIPSTVTTVVYRAFYNCSALTGVYAPDLTAWCNITFGENKPTYYANPLYYAGNLYIDGQLLTDLVIPESITELKGAVFYGCETLTSVTVHPGVTAIGEGNFSFSNDLSAVYISDLAAWCAIRFEYESANPTYKAKALTLNGQVITDLVIPEGVETLAGYNFAYCSGITSVTIPDSVTSIGDGVFHNCSGLTAIDIPAGVTEIGAEAFWYCSGLTELEIPEGVTVLGDHLAYYCTNLTKVTIPDSVTIIDSYAFYNCKKLTEVEIPAGVTKLGECAFSNCVLLSQVDIPAGVTRLEKSAFSGCTGLTSVTLPGNLYYIGSYAFSGCTGLTRMVLPEAVNSIGTYAFSGCSNLTQIRFAGDAPSIGNYAFSSVKATALYLYDASGWTDSVKTGYGGTITWQVCSRAETAAQGTCGDTATWNLDDDGVLLISGSGAMADYSTSGGKTTAPWSAYVKTIKKVVVDQNITYMGKYAFYGCSSLTEMEFLGTRPEFASNALYGVRATARYQANQSTWHPDELSNYGGTITWKPVGMSDEYMAYDDSYSSFKWYLDYDGTLTITGDYSGFPDYNGYGAAPWYPYRNHLRKVVIGGQIGYVGKLAFYYCNELREVVFESNVTEINARAFEECKKLEIIQLGEYLQSIDDFAFYGCESLSSIYIPSYYGVTIGDYAFGNCTGLTDVSIPTYITLGKGVFEYCSNLKTVYISDSESLSGFTADSASFTGVTANVIYPTGSCSYNYKRTGYGGTLTWIEADYGKCGPHASWCYDPETKVLTVSGTGRVYSTGSGGTIPWGPRRNEIQSIQVGYGISGLSQYVFEYCENAATITLPETLTRLHLSAFNDCGSLNNLILPSSLEFVDDNFSGFVRCESLADMYYFGTEEEFSQIENYAGIKSNNSTMTKHFLVLDSGTATCTEAGIQPHYHYDDTSVYDSMYDEDRNVITSLSTVPALGHDMGEWAVTTPSTCIKAGVETRECSRCDHTETQAAALADHSYQDTVVEPDCTDSGYTVHICTGCGDEVRDTFVDALGHDTVTQEGREATCTEEGLTEGSYCGRCGEVFARQEVIPVREHAWGEWTTETEATCTGEGQKRRDCADCDAFEQETVEALGHDYLAAVTYPAGVIKGCTDYTCSRCSDSYRTPWLDAAAYEGMTIACVGDSITAAYGVTKDETDYVTLLAEQLGMDYIRLGVSGTTLCTDGSRTCNIGKLTEQNLNGADVVTIAMGINDFCNAAEGYYELGDIHSTDTSTIYGAAKMWCERIAELRKTDSLSDSQFYFVTPVITSWNNSVTTVRDWDQSKTNIHGYTLREMCNAIMEVAALYDVAVIDLNLLSGMYYNDAEDNNTAVFGGDGVHPGAKGHEMMASALAKALLQNDLRDDHTHTYGSWITTTWPSCIAGEQHRVCAVCSATESRAQEPNGKHSYHAEVTPPTCTEQGHTTYTCSICGDSYVGDYVDAKDHSWSGWAVEKEPTCTEEGTAQRECADCHTFEYRTDEALGHTEVIDKAVAPTCTETGLTEGKHCSVCGEVLAAQTEVEAKGHSYKTVVTAPTCTEQGYTTYTCGICDDSYVDDYVEATGHTEVIDPAVEATCTETGLTEGKHCSVCGEVLAAQTEVEAKGHSYKAVVTAPTCTEQGHTTYTCSICADSYVDDYVEATGHTEVIDPAVEATCTETGLTEGKHCSVCGEVLKAQTVVAAKGHAEVTDKAVEATCTETGLTEGKHCSVCGAILKAQTVVVAKGHSEAVDPAVEATCTETGLTEGKHCEVCKEVLLAQQVLEPLGHSYENHICIRCGESAPTGGQLGETLSWNVDPETGKLTISGSGTLDAGTEAPWLEYADTITEVTVEEGVESIGPDTFRGMENLQSIVLPGSVTQISPDAFDDCGNLTQIQVSDSNAVYADLDGVLMSKDLTQLIKYPENRPGSEYTVPGTVTDITGGAFADCDRLEALIFTGNAPEFAEDAFADFRGSISYPGGNPTWTEDILQDYGGSIQWIPTYETEEVGFLTSDKDVLQPGGTAVLTAHLQPGVLPVEETVWTLAEGDEAFAELSGNGLTATLSAKPVEEAHTVTVLARTAEGDAEPARISITITPVAQAVTITDGDGRAVADTTVWLNVNETDAITFRAGFLPADAAGQILWSWSDTGNELALYRDNGDGSVTVSDPTGTCGTVTLTAESGSLSAEVNVKFVSLQVDREETEEEDPADLTLFSGKSKSLKVYDAETGKALTAKQIKWSLDPVYAPYATLTAKGKLTARKVVEKVRIEAEGTIIGSEGTKVIVTVDIFPAVTQVEILEDGSVVNGKTLTMDVAETERVFTVNAYPLDTAQKVTWTIGDKKNAYASYEIDGSALTVTNPTGKAGTVTIKATVNAGTKKTVSFKLSFGTFATSVEILNTETQLTAGGSLRLVGMVKPVYATKSGITWSLKDATDKAYASVSSKGILKAKTVYGERNVTVVATSKDGKARSEYTVTILPKDPGILTVKYDGRNVTKSTVDVDLNDTDTITLTAENFNSGIPEIITWKSSKTSVAIVAEGRVTFLKPGTVTVTAAASDGRKATVTVKASRLASGVTVTGETEVASGKAVMLKAAVENAASSKVTWSIEQGSAYAKISSSGKLTANKDITSAREVTVRATAKDGSGAYGEITVTIRPLAQGVQIYSQQGGRTLFSIRSSDNLWVRSNTTLEWAMNEEETLQLSSRVYPNYEEGSLRNAIQGVTWKSSSNKIATVDEEGLVTCHKPGTVTITATAKDGSGKKVSFKLKVINKIESLSMEDQSVKGGKSINLLKLLEINPTNATYKTFDWEITGGDGAAYASINAKGVLKAKKVKTSMEVEIKATAKDGSGESAEFIVIINP